METVGKTLMQPCQESTESLVRCLAKIQLIGLQLNSHQRVWNQRQTQMITSINEKREQMVM